MNRIAGYNYVENWNMVVDGKPYRVNLTWKERVFSWPWRPFKKTKFVTPKVPDPNVIIIGNQIYAHPAVIESIHQALRHKLTLARFDTQVVKDRRGLDINTQA